MVTILYVIDSLSVGGAERLLVNTINSLQDHKIIIVTLYPRNEYQQELKNATLYCLDFKGTLSIPLTVLKLRRIIAKLNPDIVHSHLLWSTFIARLATPKNIPFFFSVHSTLSKDAFEKNRLSLFLEKLTYKPHQTAIFVSEFVKEDYQKAIGLRGPAHVLHNFIPDQFFQNFRIKPDNKLHKFVAVGNLKEAKNYYYLIKAFKILKEKEVEASLDIYGSGYLENDLQKEIDQNQLPITLIGTAGSIFKILPQYDAYVLCSLHEGFGLAPVEAMAIGLPVFLSDIPVMHEISGGKAIFIDPKEPVDFASQLVKYQGGNKYLEATVSKAYTYVSQKFSRESYSKKLRVIYNL
jgi:glycosyltransferase involved in cell wall biosynthesis